MKLRARLVLLGVIVTVIGCASAPVNQPQEGDIRWLHKDGWKPYPVEKPEWVNHRGKYREDGKIPFVGISIQTTTESEAENDAYEDVAEKIAEYIGTDVGKKVDEVLIVRGLASEVLDPATKKEIARKQLSIAKIRRAFTREVFYEKSQEYRNGAWGKTAIKAYILVLYPESEIEAVEKKIAEAQQNKIKRELKKSLQEERRRLLEEADKELERLKKEGF